SVTIRETDKVANTNANAFRTATPNSVPLMAVNLLYTSLGNTYLADGAIEAYHHLFSNDATDDEDATKMLGNAETVSITNGSTSYNSARFRIVFETLNTLPVKFESVSAGKKDDGVKVTWTIAEEKGIEKYEVERAADGVTFNKIAEVAAKGTTLTETYEWMDL